VTHPYAPVLPPDEYVFENAVGHAIQEQQRGELVRALLWYRRALGLNPGSSAVYNNIGAILLSLGRLDEAADAYWSALGLKPDYARAHAGLAAVYTEMKRNLRAVTHNRAAVVIDPCLVNLRFNMGFGLQLTGQAEAASRCYRSAIGHLPNVDRCWSQYLLSLNYIDAISADDVFTEHRKYGDRFPDYSGKTFANDPDPERKLRIGYISVEFREHLGSYFIEPIIENTDRSQYEIYCYNGLPKAASDAYTEKFKRACDVWRDTADLSHGDFQRLVEEDRIDILVDLAGHSGLNRMPAVGHRPAPVQLTWLGYANTTGLRSVDGRIVDETTDPSGIADRLASESLIRMPHSFLCLKPFEPMRPAAPPPFVVNGRITFGSFNHLGKMSPTVTRLWAEILRRTPQSRLLLKDQCFGDAETQEFMRRRFADAGIEPSRIDFMGWSGSRQEHMAAYERVDIALDTVPYNGTITSCDALCMGVPFVTMAGDRHAARVGASLLRAIGLGDLAGESAADYCDIAVKLAGDRPRLTQLRAGMRDRLSASPLCDGPGYVRRLEEIYREFWRRWCEQATNTGKAISGAQA
jgi:protein O-GlcNAc transferase